MQDLLGVDLLLWSEKMKTIFGSIACKKQNEEKKNNLPFTFIILKLIVQMYIIMVKYCQTNAEVSFLLHLHHPLLRFLHLSSALFGVFQSTSSAFISHYRPTSSTVTPTVMFSFRMFTNLLWCLFSSCERNSIFKILCWIYAVSLLNTH